MPFTKDRLFFSVLAVALGGLASGAVLTTAAFPALAQSGREATVAMQPDRGGAAQAPEPTPKRKAAKTKTAKNAEPQAPRRRSGSAKDVDLHGQQAIVVLVNDEPITGYEVDQRATLMALSSGSAGDMKAKAEARWAQIAKDPKTNERFKKLLQENNVQTKEEAKALQQRFIKQLQHNMIEQLKRETRNSALAASRKKALEELIEERLKLQEAKRNSALASDEEVSRIINGMAGRNKMNEKQFAQHLKGMGVDINTMRQRVRASLSWTDVIRRKFGHQVAVADADIDRLVASAPGGEDEVDLQVHRIRILLPAKSDQSKITESLHEADMLRAKFSGCKNTASLAAGVTGAKFEDLGERKPSSIPEPTRSLLLSAADGEMLPPRISDDGVELWAVCGRKVVKADDKKRTAAQDELRQREFGILAQRHLKDLRQDAHIEYR
jgi:peptidyl-prolyl cis-trans isomerase SurA